MARYKVDVEGSRVSIQNLNTGRKVTTVLERIDQKIELYCKVSADGKITKLILGSLNTDRLRLSEFYFDMEGPDLTVQIADDGI